jgi:hypothetical protein
MTRINPQLNIDPVSPIFTGSLSANGITSTASFLSNGSKWVQDSSGFTIQNLSNINLLLQLLLQILQQHTFFKLETLAEIME